MILLQTNGVRSHVVAIVGDATGDTVSDLAAGEIGLSRNGKRVIFRQGWTEVIDPAEIRLVAPLLHWSPDGVTFYKLATEGHVHSGIVIGGSNTQVPVPSVGPLTG